ncbi:MAG: acyl-homoserine-lactone synthase [Ktedonobacteraceae bacterium]
MRQDEYQRLRATTFVEQLGWDIPVDAEGRERDRYDCLADTSIRTYGTYGHNAHTEHLLGGMRIFSLQRWEDSMVFNEFRAAGIIPDGAIRQLKAQYDCHNMLELTRFCVRRGRWYMPSSVHTKVPFSCIIARDLTFASACAVAEETGRQQALILVDAAYFRVLRKSHFIFAEISHGLDVSLIVIDIWATIQAIRLAGERSQADRMLALCCRGNKVATDNWRQQKSSVIQH